MKTKPLGLGRPEVKPVEQTLEDDRSPIGYLKSQPAMKQEAQSFGLSSPHFCQYLDEVKRALLVRKSQVEQEWDPFIASWLAYAFVHGQDLHSSLFQELFQRLDKWSQGEDVWQWKRNIGPLFFVIWLRKRQNLPISEIHVHKAIQMLQTLNPDNKFSPLRSPDQVFLIALGVSAIDQVEAKEYLHSFIPLQVKGTLARRIIFCAALKEIGIEHPLSLSETKDIADIIALLWWAGRENIPDKSRYWTQFAKNINEISLYRDDKFTTKRILSDFELALLFEALAREHAI